MYVKGNNTLLGSVESNKIDNVYTNNIASVISASTDDINVDHYNYTQYKFDNQIDSKGIIVKMNSIASRIPYNVDSINVNDTLYFDYIINTNSSTISVYFNDTGIVANVISLGNNTYRILGSHTVTKYDITGTSDGRLFDYDQMRFIDISYQESSTRSILNEFTYLNPTITTNTFSDSLSVAGNNTLYKIEAVDKAGNISESTYVLVNNTNSDSFAINNIVTISKDYYYRKLGTSATLQ